MVPRDAVHTGGTSHQADMAEAQDMVLAVLVAPLVVPVDLAALSLAANPREVQATQVLLVLQATQVLLVLLAPLAPLVLLVALSRLSQPHSHSPQVLHHSEQT